MYETTKTSQPELAIRIICSSAAPHHHAEELKGGPRHVVNVDSAQIQT